MIPPGLIFDPLAPIPARLGKKDRERLSELRQAYQASVRTLPKNKPLTKPEEVFEFIRPYFHGLAVEQLFLIALDARCLPISEPIVLSRGDIDGTECGVRLVLRSALIAGAKSFVMVHNHPSGDPSPSDADRRVTRTIAKGSKLVDCDMVDHVVVGGSSFASIRRSNPELWLQ